MARVKGCDCIECLGIDDEGEQLSRKANFLVDIIAGFLMFLTVVVLVAGIFAPVGAYFHHDDHVECLRLSEQTGIETRMVGNAWDAECYIRVEDSMIPVDKWRPLAPVVR